MSVILVEKKGKVAIGMQPRTLAKLGKAWNQTHC